MKTFILFLTFSISITVYAQQSKAKYWHRDSLLTWEDFRGPVDTNFKFGAVTQTRYYYDYNLEKVNGKDVAVCTAKCYFDRSSSWSVVDKRSNELLAHEQLHFNITEYFTSQFQDMVNTYKFLDINNARKEIRSIYTSVYAQCNEIQLLYDQETNHGTKSAKQKQWEILISDALDKNIPLAEILKNVPK